MSAFALGLKTVLRYCEEQNTLDWYKAKLSVDMFKLPERPVFEWVSSHVKKYHTMPQKETLLAKFPELASVSAPEPSKYYLTHLENRYFYEKINAANLESQNILKANPDHIDASMAVLKKAMAEIAKQRYRAKIVDVGKDGPLMTMTAYHNVLLLEKIAEFGWPYLDTLTGGLMGGDLVSFVGRPAAGKAQPLTSKVLTAGGFKFMGDIQVGDKLASIDGQSSVVTGVFPQGKKPVFTLTFQDGRTVEASDEHLWEVHYRGWDVPKVETTLQLIARLKSKRYQRRLSISLFSGEFGKPVEAPFSAYLLGVFLGDGCLRSSTPSLTSVDPEILSRIGSELAVLGLGLSQGWGRGGIQYSASDTRMGTCAQENRLRKWFKDLGVWGLKSEHKYIPAQYLEADHETRVQLLQGLMDTDGTAGKNGCVSFSSSSKTLAEQVQYLVRSLGGKASVSVKKTPRLDHWVVHIVAKDRKALFGLPRKKVRVVGPRTTHTNHRLTLIGIEYLGEDECQCIQVSHPSRLYVSDDFVVTHNTFLTLRTALHNWRAGRDGLFVSMEMSPLPILQRIAAMYAHTNLTQLKMGAYSTKGKGGTSSYAKFTAGLKGMASEKAKLYVVDGNLAASGEDVYELAAQMGVGVVYIDGAYLLRHKNTRLDRFTRVAENTEIMKTCTTEMEIPTFASWQFNRDASKKKDQKQKGGIEDIAFTDVIGQISSVVLGLYQEDTVETLHERYVGVMKGRNGEIGGFRINWGFNDMNFDQIVEGEGAAKPQLENL